MRCSTIIRLPPWSPSDQATSAPRDGNSAATETEAAAPEPDAAASVRSSLGLPAAPAADEPAATPAATPAAIPAATLANGKATKPSRFKITKAPNVSEESFSPAAAPTVDPIAQVVLAEEVVVTPGLLRSPSSNQAIGIGWTGLDEAINAEGQDSVPPLTSTPSKAAVAANLAAKGAILLPYPAGPV